ncbi:hypothetical protein LPJ81_005388 [Coemansia sp. IMI 209127]|nr:hypothetical protein LPJ81_005388 [Coemansia sp. IMI 209127]
MATEDLFFSSTLAELSELTTSVRTFAADSKVPATTRYPCKTYGFQMAPVQTVQLASEDRQDYFTLNFKTLKAPVRKYTVHASSVRTVGQVKRHLSRISNIAVPTMRLVLAGKGLVDTKLIGDYNVAQDAVIQIITRPAGDAGGAVTPTTEEEEEDEAEKLAVVDQANPLLSALGKRNVVVSREAAMQKSMAGLHEQHTSDASSDGEGSSVSQTTKEQLQARNSAFRNSLRSLVHGQFGASQASIVDRHLDTFFTSL